MQLESPRKLYVPVLTVKHLVPTPPRVPRSRQPFRQRFFNVRRSPARVICLWWKKKFSLRGSVINASSERRDFVQETSHRQSSKARYRPMFESLSRKFWVTDVEEERIVSILHSIVSELKIDVRNFLINCTKHVPVFSIHDVQTQAEKKEIPRRPNFQSFVQIGSLDAVSSQPL